MVIYPEMSCLQNWVAGSLKLCFFCDLRWLQEILHHPEYALGVTVSMLGVPSGKRVPPCTLNPVTPLYY